MNTPMPPTSQINFNQIFDIFLRRKWLILIPLCVSLTVGFIMIFLVNRSYEASTLILVQPQRLPKEYVRSIVTSTIEQRVGTISQQILSRTNLEKTIDQFGLYEDNPEMYLEDKIYDLKKRIRVKLERTKTGADAFSISYKGGNPNTVMQITNTLAAFFMDENLKVRESQAIGTSEFLDSELQKTKQRLEEYEKKRSEYRQKHLGGLPEELDSNLKTLDRLQMQLSNKQTLLWEAKNTLNTLEFQYTTLKDQIENQKQSNSRIASNGKSVILPTGHVLSESELALQQLKQQYQDIFIKYTEKHPDVKRLKRQIDNLEKTIFEEKEKNTSLNQSVEVAGIETLVKGQASEEIVNLALQQELQINTIRNEIKKNQMDIVNLEKQMKVYQDRVENTPKREMELQSLQRDYANIQEIYNSILDRKLEAELSVNMEKKQQGEQFRILDYARLPEKPISPNVFKFFIFSIAVGLFLGVGIVAPLEFFDSSIRNDDQIEKDIGLNILAVIPPLQTSKDKLKQRVDYIAFSIFGIYSISFILLFWFVNARGLDRALNFFKNYANL